MDRPSFVREPAASRRGSRGGPPPAHSRPGPPGLEFPQEAPGRSRGGRFTRTAASCRSSLGGPPPAHSQPGPPGLEFPQEAPGRSRGTPGRMPSQVPCNVGLSREIACRHLAWTAGWFSCPESPGFHPGLLGRAPRPISNSKDLQHNVRKRIAAAATPCRATPRNIKTCATSLRFAMLHAHDRGHASRLRPTGFFGAPDHE